MILLAVLALAGTLGELILYALLVPDPRRKPRAPRPLDAVLGMATYRVAYLLSLLRTPLGLVLYLAKLVIVFGLGVPYDAMHTTYRREALHLAGDVANLALTALVVQRLARPGSPWPRRCALYIPLIAEGIRLATERLPLLFSTVWQLLPHRSIGRAILRRRRSSIIYRLSARILAHYCRYYARDDAGRARYLLRALWVSAARDADLAGRLSYITAFRIVPRRQGLRGGQVRDVATGAVFIHGVWTADPWLLAGLAIRRAPWMFDARYLRRPFYYWSEANRAATLAVLCHARYCPPFAAFQFGHEIRVARLHLFYGALRRLGLDVEEAVREDGTFAPDQLIRWLERRRRGEDGGAGPRPLAADADVLAELRRCAAAGRRLEAGQIAARYTYPLAYVRDVLVPTLDVERRDQAKCMALHESDLTNEA